MSDTSSEAPNTDRVWLYSWRYHQKYAQSYGTLLDAMTSAAAAADYGDEALEAIVDSDGTVYDMQDVRDWMREYARLHSSPYPEPEEPATPVYRTWNGEEWLVTDEE